MEWPIAGGMVGSSSKAVLHPTLTRPSFSRDSRSGALRESPKQLEVEKGCLGNIKERDWAIMAVITQLHPAPYLVILWINHRSHKLGKEQPCGRGNGRPVHTETQASGANSSTFSLNKYLLDLEVPCCDLGP